MDIRNRNRQIALLLVHTAIFINTAIIACIGIFQGAGSGQVGDGVVGLGYFKPFTMDSNILAGISSLILVICAARNLAKGQDSTPRWAVDLQLMAAACLSLTMLVAAAFLGPMEILGGRSYFTMFRDDMFFFHLLNPVLAIVSIMCLQKKYRLDRRDWLLSAAPTVIYSIVYLVMVVFLKRWSDFYGFTFGGRYAVVPLVIIVIYALVLAMSAGLMAGHNAGQ